MRTSNEEEESDKEIEDDEESNEQEASDVNGLICFDGSTKNKNYSLF